MLDPAAKEALWFRKLLIALDLETSCATELLQLFTDLANAISKSKKASYMPATRWLDTRWFFINDLIEKDLVKLQHIAGTGNPADGLTKALGKVKFDKFHELFNLRDIDCKIKFDI